jgi:hypothetical protein
MFGHKIKLDHELFDKIKRCADAAGYSSPAEFALHVLEKETTRILGPGGSGSVSEEELRKRLEGLGYIE